MRGVLAGSLHTSGIRVPKFRGARSLPPTESGNGPAGLGPETAQDPIPPRRSETAAGGWGPMVPAMLLHDILCSLRRGAFKNIYF